MAAVVSVVVITLVLIVFTEENTQYKTTKRSVEVTDCDWGSTNSVVFF